MKKPKPGWRGSEAAGNQKKGTERKENRNTEKEYQAGGATALLDAIGRTIRKIVNAQRHTAEEYRAEAEGSRSREERKWKYRREQKQGREKK